MLDPNGEIVNEEIITTSPTSATVRPARRLGAPYTHVSTHACRNHIARLNKRSLIPTPLRVTTAHS